MYSESPPDCQPDLIHDITGVILAGGGSRRMGRNKALLPVGNTPMIEIVHNKLTDIFRKILLVTNTPDEYHFLSCDKTDDIYCGCGPLGGIHTALSKCHTDRIFVTACDMPFIKSELVRYLCGMSNGFDAVVPESSHGLEPLCAIYSKSALAKITEALERKRYSMREILSQLSIKIISYDEIIRLDITLDAFRNINTPDEYKDIYFKQTKQTFYETD